MPIDSFFIYNEGDIDLLFNYAVNKLPEYKLKIDYIINSNSLNTLEIENLLSNLKEINKLGYGIKDYHKLNKYYKKI
jgi:hypothetical protein